MQKDLQNYKKGMKIDIHTSTIIISYWRYDPAIDSRGLQSKDDDQVSSILLPSLIDGLTMNTLECHYQNGEQC
jgi:hypothetical protein